MTRCEVKSDLVHLYEVFIAHAEDEMDRAFSTNVEKRNAYRISVRKPDGKRPLGSPRRR
jgi:hypothetical protein